MKVEVVPHDETWRHKFAEESQQIIHALGDNVIVIHHIGTFVGGLLFPIAYCLSLLLSIWLKY